MAELTVTGLKEEREDAMPTVYSKKRQILTVISLSIVNLSTMMNLSVMGPLFPSEAMRKGASQTVVGLVFGCYSLVTLSAAPLLATFIPNIGAKLMFLSGVFLSGLCSIVFGFLVNAPDGVPFISLCFVIQSFGAIGCASSMTSSFTILAHTFPKNITTALGVLELFSGLGFLLGPPLGGFLYALGGYEVPFIVVGFLVLLTVPVNMIILLSVQGSKHSGGSFLNLLRISEILVVSLVVCSIGSALGFLDPTLGPFVKEEYDLDSFQTSLVFIATSLPYGICSPFLGYFTNNRPNFGWWMMTACSAGGALCFCLLGPIPVFKYKMELWHFITVLVVMGIFSSGAFVPSFAGILLSAKNHGFEDNLRTLGLVSGLFTSLWSLGNVIGPTIAGILSDVAGYKWAFAIEGSLLFLVAIIMILFHLCSHKSRNRSPVPNQLEPLEENSPLQS